MRGVLDSAHMTPASYYRSGGSALLLGLSGKCGEGSHGWPALNIVPVLRLSRHTGVGWEEDAIPHEAGSAQHEALGWLWSFPGITIPTSRIPWLLNQCRTSGVGQSIQLLQLSKWYNSVTSAIWDCWLPTERPLLKLLSLCPAAP